ncbi:MAG: hypothetical protein PVH59_01710 [Anaerolineae bacterium]|jgi:hypothetical protein
MDLAPIILGGQTHLDQIAAATQLVLSIQLIILVRSIVVAALSCYNGRPGSPFNKGLLYSHHVAGWRMMARDPGGFP